MTNDGDAPVVTTALRRAIASLDTAKGRARTGWWMAEGTKAVLDTIGHFRCAHLLATPAWCHEHPACSQAMAVPSGELGRLSHLATPPEVLAVYEIPQPKKALPPFAGRLTVALDRVQDPGNLGTIVRVCDWMGVTDIVASSDTACVWNPKVVQATMGAIARVTVHYVPDLAQVLAHSGVEVYGMALDGGDIYKAAFVPEGIVVMGNEGSGISPEVSRAVSRRLLIPSYPPGRPTSESLNVAIATAITLAEFRRRAQG